MTHSALSLPVLTVTLVLTIALTGCKQAAEKAAEKALEKAIEADSGEKVDIDLSGGNMVVKDLQTGQTMTMNVNDTKDGQAFTITGAEGELEFNVTEADELPADWPAAFPEYPGSTIESVQSINMQEIQQQIVTLHTADTIKQVLDFYADAAQKAGYTQEMRFVSDDGGQIGFVKGVHRLIAIAAAEEDMTAVTLQSITSSEADAETSEEEPIQDPATDGAEDDTESDSEAGLNSPGTPDITFAEGSLPEDFPSELIPSYEAATIQQAAYSTTEGMLMQTATAEPTEILDFYKSHFESLGYRQSGTIEMDGILMHQYENNGKNITVSIQPSEETNQITIGWGE
jgi:hypothetical protein